MDIATTEIILRLGVATVTAGAVGLNRDLHGKPIGVRTLGLVGLATAMAVLLADAGIDRIGISDATSRVIQGVLTGVGFLGAGVIVHGTSPSKVHGLTSAACVWFTACLGVICGAGEWRLILIGGVLAMLLLTLGRPIERLSHRLLGGSPRDGNSGDDTKRPAADQSGAGPHQPGK